MKYISKKTKLRKKRRKKIGVAGLLVLLVAGALCAAMWDAGGAWTRQKAVLAAASVQAQPVEAAAAANYVVALDPGHGGADYGAVGVNGNEKEVTEATVRALQTLLDADENYTPVLCRDWDECPTPTQRSALADSAGAQLLLSVHANGSESTVEHGFECFAAPPGRTYHDDSLRFAHAIVAAFGGAGAMLRGETGVLYNYYVEGSEELPNGYDRFAVDETDLTVLDNLVSYGMVDRPHCPAVLAEQGFMSNSADAAWLSEEGCAEAARLYYEAICAYFGTQPTA